MTADTRVTDLRVGYDGSPAAVEPDRVRFSWRVETGRRGARQAAYRLLVARSREALEIGRPDVWDSGWVEDDRATDVPYGGPPIEPDTRYRWSVRVRNETSDVLKSESATFATALGGAADWDGEWIAHRPEADANGYRSRWRADDGEEWVRVDLGETREIDAVELYPTEPFDGPETPDGKDVTAVWAAEDGAGEGAVGFGFPVRYRIEVADDPTFEDARTVVDRTDEASDPPAEPQRFDATAEGRYVRVTATECYEFDPGESPSGPVSYKPQYVREERRSWWVFALAGLAVRAPDGEDLAVGRPVEASSSVEGSTWSREHLVDGVYGPITGSSSPLLRTEVDLGKPIAAARAHVSTLGYGEFYVNGERVGDDVLGPWTEFDERAPYATYEVGGLLSEGENAIGLWLGRGWLSKNVRDWTGFGSPRAILQLDVEYEDGTTRSVSTDSTWRTAESPIVENDVYDGETYDARREQRDWAEPGFDDSEWDDAGAVSGPGGDLRPEIGPPMRVVESVEPAEILDREEGPIVDFGQNLTGWVELSIPEADAGHEIKIEHAETLLDDGSLNTIDLRSADTTDVYVSDGEDATYQPRFTYHGFRYAQVVGYPGVLSAADIEAQVVHTDFESAGSFDCSNGDLRQVQQNARWGLRGNAHSVPTDCPQRDERFGWTGDAHIATRGMLYNFDAVGFHEKWQADHDDSQSRHGYLNACVPHGHGGLPADPTWTITRVTLPWHLYRHYGDEGVLDRHYEEMRRYVDYWHAETDDGILGDEYGDYGDWLAFENADGRRGLPHDLFNTAFHYHVTNLFADIASVLGREADAEGYAARAAEVREAFDREFYDPETNSYGPGTQSSFAVPLFVGLVPEDRESDVAAALAEKVRADDGKLQTGFLGTRPLLFVLTEHGYADLAYEVASQPERPGWVYMVREGATTMWERWDTNTRIGDGMNSFNHSPFTFVTEWFFAGLAGLDFETPRKLEIAPAFVEELEWAEGSVETVNGPFASRWERDGDDVSLEATVPWNATATVRLPTGEVREGGADVWRDGEAAADLPVGIEEVAHEGEEVVLRVGAGEYEFEIER